MEVHYQGKDHPRLIALSDCARPCSYERKFATFECKGTTFFSHTQENRQKYCRFSISRVLFPISYNYTPAIFHALKTHANALRAHAYTSKQRQLYRMHIKLRSPILIVLVNAQITRTIASALQPYAPMVSHVAIMLARFTSCARLPPSLAGYRQKLSVCLFLAIESMFVKCNNIITSYRCIVSVFR